MSDVIYSTTKMIDVFHPTNVRIRMVTPTDQDVTAVLITAYNTDTNEQLYVKEFVWKPYQGFDLLDTSQVSFTGHTNVRYLP